MIHLYNVNHHFFAASLFRDLHQINLFATTYVRYQALSRPVFCYHNHTIKSGSPREIFATIRHSRKLRIKVGLQYIKEVQLCICVIQAIDYMRTYSYECKQHGLILFVCLKHSKKQILSIHSELIFTNRRCKILLKLSFKLFYR